MSSDDQEWRNSLRRYTDELIREINRLRLRPHFDYPRQPRRPLTIEFGLLGHEPRTTGRRGSRVFSEEHVLGVTSIQPQIDANSRAHHCDRFSGSRHGILIVRRGQAFQLVFQLTSQFRIDFDQIQLVFTYSGSRFITGQDGVEKVEVLSRTPSNSNPETWRAELTEINRAAVSIEVTPSVIAAVGEWKLTVVTRVSQRSSLVRKSFQYTGPIYILFNPWSPSDDVYLSSARERDEYVLADTGIIYSGRKDRISELAWVFGQHERNVLEIVCYALRELAELDVQRMASPVYVSRAISSIINGHLGRDGIIEGNWSDEFHDREDSRPPWEWSSSVEILELFHRKGSVVRYGQCFVFAGVCNTMCRALGLPSRCVTNYRSAHDVHGNLTLDYLLDENGKVIREKTNDSIWSFHVWNEVWMKRNDLNVPGDFDGWQVVDATPQEISNGEFRVGPCSVKAVRRGEVNVSYDGIFVLAEVNADVVYYKKTKNGLKKEIKRLIDDRPEAPQRKRAGEKIGQNYFLDSSPSRDDTPHFSVGFSITTKGVLNNERVDITNSYKPREGTIEERQIYQRALKLINPQLHRFADTDGEYEPLKAISFELKKPADFNVGESVRFAGIAKNESFDNKFNVQLFFKISSHTYAGTQEKIIKRVEYNELLQPRDAVEFDVAVNFSEYSSALKGSEHFSIQMRGFVKESNDDFIAMEEFTLTPPRIFILCDKHQKVGRSFTITMSMKNPLPIGLNNAEFVIEAPGITKQLRATVRRAPQAHEHFSVEAQLTPKGFGKKNIVISFNCDELHHISAIKQIYVTS